MATQSLTRIESAIYDYLASRAGKVVTRNQIMQAVYGYSDFSASELRSVDVHVNRIRRKVGRTCIETVRGYGYTFGSSKPYAEVPITHATADTVCHVCKQRFGTHPCYPLAPGTTILCDGSTVRVRVMERQAEATDD